MSAGSGKGGGTGSVGPGVMVLHPLIQKKAKAKAGRRTGCIAVFTHESTAGLAAISAPMVANQPLPRRSISLFC